MSMHLDRERLLPEASRELAGVLGEALRTLVVYGSAAGPEFRPRSSDVNLAAILEPLEFAHLQRAAQWWGRWRRDRFAAPLLLSATDLARSRDVFPLELLDMQARHRTLAGVELFDGLVFGPQHVRAECEREAKGKLVRLRELYLELAGSQRELRALMLDSRKSFVQVMRGLLHLHGEPWSGDEHAVAQLFERRYGCRFTVMQRLADAASDDPVERHFGEYLAEVETLAALADREARSG